MLVTSFKLLYYKIPKLASFFLPFLFLPNRSLQKRKPNSKLEFRITYKYEWSTITINLHYHNLSPYSSFLPLGHAWPGVSCTAKHKSKKQFSNFQRTWCCIRTQSLFISVKFWSTNSTASTTLSASLQKMREKNKKPWY